MKPTRLRLLDYLKRHPDSTAGELARVLQLTHADVRYHLNLLCEEGAVLITGRKRKGRGRPGRRYRLAAEAPQERSDLLAGALLAEISPGLTPPEQEALLRRIAQRLLASSAPGAGPRQPGPRGRGLSGVDLIRAVDRLNNLGYQARWEAHFGAPSLILAHSPFASVQASFPLLRRLDDLLVESILAVPVQRVEDTSPSEDAETFAVYRLLI